MANPLQCSCLENPMDRGAWLPTTHRVTKSRTQLKRLSSSSMVLYGASQVALVVKNPFANAGDIRDVGSIPGSGRFSRGGHGNPLQYSRLGNLMDRGVWWATVHRVTKS